MVFESNFNMDSVQYADIYNYPKEPKAKDSHGAGWSSTPTTGSMQNPQGAPNKPQKQKKKQQGGEENPSWGPVYKNRSNFNDMHCF